MGSLARFGISLATQHLGFTRFPWATLTVNAVGGFLIGILGALFLEKTSTHPLRLLLITGFLGGFTTFSAFSLETLMAFQRGDTRTAILNTLANNALALALVFLGFWIGRRFLIHA